jgi:hypothetical protein
VSDERSGRPWRAGAAGAAWLLLFLCQPGCTERGPPGTGAPPASPRNGGAAPSTRASGGAPGRIPGTIDCGGAPCALDDVCLACGTDVFHCVPAATTCCGVLPCAPGNVCVPCPPGEVPTCLPKGAPCR